MTLWAVVGAATAGLALGAFAALPGVIGGQLEERLSARTGLRVQVDGVSVGFGELRVDTLRLGGDDSGVRLVLEGLHVRYAPARILWAGAAAIAAVDVEAVSAQIDSSRAEGWPASEGAGSEDRRASTGQARPLPQLRVHRLNVALADEAGVLIEMDGHDAVSEAGQFAVDLAQLAAGGTGGRVRLAGVRVEGELRLRRPLVSALSVESFRLSLPEPDAQELGLVGRLRRLRARLTERRHHRQRDAGADAAKPAEGRLWGLGPWLTEDARLVAAGGALAGANGDEVALPGSVSMVLHRTGEGVALSGEAKGNTGGAVTAAFEVRDEPFGADGELVVDALPLSAVAPLMPLVPWREPVSGSLEAKLVLRTEALERVGVAGRVDVRGASFESARLAATPVSGVDVTLEGRGTVLPLRRRLELEAGKATLGAIPLLVRGALELADDHYEVDLHAELPRADCDAAVRAIPRDLLGDLVHARWGGGLAGKVGLTVDSRDLDATALEVDIRDHCAFERVPALVDLRRFRVPFVHTVRENDGTLFELETGPGTVNWTYLEDVSPLLVHAVLAHEDSRFFEHQGFSPPHIRNALARNLKEGRYVVGASTITMQLVKNIFLRREKTLARKTQEVLLTWWIERVMEKRDILELYLNVIEYGPGVYGIREAARYYFKRLPSDLSPAEAVYLSTVLPNPKRYHVQYERGRISEPWAERMRKILSRLKARGRYEPAVADYGLAELGGFGFVKEGEFAKARDVPTGTAALPYMAGELTGWDAADYAPAVSD